MKIELNFVKIDGIQSSIAQLVARRREELEADPTQQILKFIQDNIKLIGTSKIDPNLVNNILTAQELTTIQLQSIRYMLANSGFDIWVSTVSDEEVNPTDIPQGVYEYNIFNGNLVANQFIQHVSKLQVPQSANSMTDLYDKLVSAYGLFSGKPFEGLDNPITEQINVMRPMEQAIGSVPVTLTTYCNSIIEFLGLRITALYA